MKRTRRAARLVAGFLVLTAGVVSPGQIQAEDKLWILQDRTLPVPIAASKALRESIATTPQPDVAAHIQKTTVETKEEWLTTIKSAAASTTPLLEALTDRLKVTVSKEKVAGVTVRIVLPVDIDPANKDRLFIHTHGGAYVFGGGRAGLVEAILIAHRAKIPVLSIDYRMPPAHPFPAAVDDVVAVWKNLLEGRDAKSMALGGTSAGGGLALASIHKLIQLGLTLPAAIFAGTPWSDLTQTGDSFFTNEGVDRVLVSYDGLVRDAAELYAGDHELKNPLISPVYGDFKGFPPTYLVTGTRDLFLSNTVRIHRKLRTAGVAADLNVYEGESHADYIFVMDSPESHQVYGELGAFLLKHLE